MNFLILFFIFLFSFTVNGEQSCVGIDFIHMSGQNEVLRLNSYVQRIDQEFGEGKVLDLGSYEVDGKVSPLRVLALISKNGSLEKTRVVSATGSLLSYSVRDTQANGLISLYDGKNKILSVQVIDFKRNSSGTIQIEALKNKSSQLSQTSIVSLKTKFKFKFGPKDWEISIKNNPHVLARESTDDKEQKRSDIVNGIIKSPLWALDMTVGTLFWNLAFDREGREEVIANKVIDKIMAPDETGRQSTLELFMDSSSRPLNEKLVDAELKVRKIATIFAKEFTPKMGTISNTLKLTKEAYRMFSKVVITDYLSSFSSNLSKNELNTQTEDIMENFSSCLDKSSTKKQRDVADCIAVFSKDAPFLMAQKIIDIYFKKYFAPSIPLANQSVVKNVINNSLQKCSTENYFVNYDKAVKSGKLSDFDYASEIQACVYSSFIDGLLFAMPFSIDKETEAYFKHGDKQLSELKEKTQQLALKCLKSSSFINNDEKAQLSYFKKLPQAEFVEKLMVCKDQVVTFVAEQVVKKEISETQELKSIVKDDLKKLEIIQKAAIDKGLKVCLNELKNTGKGMDILLCKPKIFTEATLAAMEIILDENIKNYFVTLNESELLKKQEDFKEKLVTAELKNNLLNAYRESPEAASNLIESLKTRATFELINDYMGTVIKEYFPDSSEEKINSLIAEAAKDRKTGLVMDLKDELKLVYSLKNEDEQNAALNVVTGKLYLNAIANLTPALVSKELKANNIFEDTTNYENEAKLKMNQCLDEVLMDNDEVLSLDEISLIKASCEKYVSNEVLFSLFSDTLFKSMKDFTTNVEKLDKRIVEEKSFLINCLTNLTATSKAVEDVFRICPIISASRIISDVVYDESEHIDIINDLNNEFRQKEILACTQDLIAKNKENVLSVEGLSDQEQNVLNFLFESPNVTTSTYTDDLINCLLKKAAPKVSSQIIDNLLDPNRKILLSNGASVKLESEIKEENQHYFKKEIQNIMNIFVQNIENVSIDFKFNTSTEPSKGRTSMIEVLDQILLRINKAYNFESEDFNESLTIFSSELNELFKSKELVTQDDFLNLFYDSALGRAVVRAEMSGILKEQLLPQIKEMKLDKAVNAYGDVKGIDGKLVERLTSAEMVKKIFLTANGEKLYKSIVDLYLKPLMNGQEIKEIPISLRESLTKAVLADVDEQRYVKEKVKLSQSSEQTNAYTDLIAKKYIALNASEVLNEFNHFSDRELGFILRQDAFKRRFNPKTQKMLDELLVKYLDDGELARIVKSKINNGEIRDEEKKVVSLNDGYLTNITRGGFTETFFSDLTQNGLNEVRRTAKAKLALVLGMRVEGNSFNSFNWDNDKGVGLRDTSSGKEQFEIFANSILGINLLGSSAHPSVSLLSKKMIKEESLKQMAEPERIEKINEIFNSSKNSKQIRKNVLIYLSNLEGVGDEFNGILKDQNLEEFLTMAKSLSAKKGLRLLENPLRVEVMLDPTDKDVELYLNGDLLIEERRIKEGIYQATIDVDKLSDKDKTKQINENYLRYAPSYGI